MALKKPGELFDGRIPEKPTINVGNSHIREEFNKVEELRKQLNDVSSSLDNSLTEVVNKNLNFLTTEYSSLLEKVNTKINIFKEEIKNKVIDLEKSNQHLRTGITVVEKRQNKINIDQIKEEVISDVQDLLSGDVANNFKLLEDKIEVIRESYQQTLNEGLLDNPPSTKNSDPLTPTDQKFATIDDLNKHYNLFLNRIQQQLTTLGGGGAVNIRDLDDVDLSTAQVNNKFLKYDSATSKWVGSDTSGGGYTLPVGSATTLGGVKVGSGLTITATGILSTTGGDGSIAGINTTGTSYFNQINASGTVTANAFSGDGSGLTGITGSGSGVVIKNSGSAVGTAGTIDFGNNLSVSPIHLGIVTVTGSAGSASTQFVAAETLTVSGVTTHYQDVQFPGAAYNILWDQATSKIKFDDSAQCVFGSASGGDMKLFHASGNSTIRNETGQFRIAGNDIRIQTQNHSEDYIICTDGGDVKIFFNDSEKFKTTNHGVDITGIATATSFSGSGASLTALNASNLGSGTVPTARLGSGTANSGVFLRGDNTWAAAGGGGSLDTRGDTSAATGSIAQTASADITIPTRGKSFSLLKVSISAPAWVVLYVDTASRSSDSSRAEGTDPAPGSGVLTEVSTTTSGSSTFLMSPAVLGWNNDTPSPAAQIYAKVTNKRATSGSNAITVTLTTVGLEA